LVSEKFAQDCRSVAVYAEFLEHGADVFRQVDIVVHIAVVHRWYAFFFFFGWINFLMLADMLLRGRKRDEGAVSGMSGMSGVSGVSCVRLRKKKK
jgi:hypothetical protein